jgi:2-C-methyl-D-erythritol 4-phosphate cytidylyltransferase
MEKKGFSVIILAAGSGNRMKSTIKKQYIKLDNKEILAYSIEIFENMSEVDEIILVVPPREIPEVKEKICDKYSYRKITHIVEGGKERQDSVWEGLRMVNPHNQYVAVHDGARPFVKKEKIRECLQVAQKVGASILAVPVTDTIKKVQKENNEIFETPERSSLWAAQTPQIFKKSLFLQGYRYAQQNDVKVTDDSMLIELIGEKISVVEGDYSNIKITTPRDLWIGESILKNKM